MTKYSGLITILRRSFDGLLDSPNVTGRAGAGGSVLLLAHTRSNNLILGIYQDVTSSAVTAMGKGCQWNQDLPAFLKKAGLRSVSFERHVGGTISMIRAVKTA